MFSTKFLGLFKVIDRVFGLLELVQHLIAGLFGASAGIFLHPAGVDELDDGRKEHEKADGRRRQPQTGFDQSAAGGGGGLHLARPYRADEPNHSSIRSNWLYFATRSLRHGAPVLI